MSSQIWLDQCWSIIDYWTVTHWAAQRTCICKPTELGLSRSCLLNWSYNDCTGSKLYRRLFFGWPIPIFRCTNTFSSPWYKVWCHVSLSVTRSQDVCISLFEAAARGKSHNRRIYVLSFSIFFWQRIRAKHADTIASREIFCEERWACTFVRTCYCDLIFLDLYFIDNDSAYYVVTMLWAGVCNLRSC